MNRRIAQLIEEQKNKSNIFNTKDLDAKVARTQEDYHKIEVPTPDREDVLPLNSRKESPQQGVTMPKEDKN